ncbi:ammonium transporter [Magnetovibrio sp. PR-2]|uniref:ammonium transporter n=1 Tax=Magnetovibrio sp. PR-2 TaxID=3120356 RepID=UPI002FCE2661
MKSNLLKLSTLGVALSLAAVPAHAEVSGETAFIFNTLSFLMHGFLVMWMAAGFAMLEGGLVRTKNTSMQMLKNIGIYSIAGIMYYLVGYNLMYMDVSGYIGSFAIWGASDPAITEAGFVADQGSYSAGSDWFFQMVFVAATASIVSGTVAERVKMWPFMIFVVLLTGIIYPIQGSWSWGGGWLSELGFSDFAGSSIVHSVGGWAALAGAIIIGARKGKYGPEGQVRPIPGANLPLATLGTFILWMGWFGFNGGSQLAMGSAADVRDIGSIYINTNLAAAGGVVAAMLLTQVIYKKVDLTMALNGALAGLVSITAEPLAPTPGLAIIIGAIGGIIVVFAVPALDKLKIDDVVGAISVHLVAGIWGTIAVVFSGADIVAQLTGIVAIGAYTFIFSAIVWFALKVTVGVRVSEEEEMDGLDKAELGLEAYPEFGHGSAKL